MTLQKGHISTIKGSYFSLFITNIATQSIEAAENEVITK